MHQPRMEHLRDLLRADAANPTGVRFDLGGWLAQADPDYPRESRVNYELVEGSLTKLKDPAPSMSCSTFACALGLACLDPEFQAQGLHYMVRAKLGGVHAWMIPAFEDHAEFNAGAAFFGISYEDAQYLFDPDCYDGTPVEAEGELFVAKRIDDFINGDIDYTYHPDRCNSDCEDNEDNED